MIQSGASCLVYKSEQGQGSEVMHRLECREFSWTNLESSTMAKRHIPDAIEAVKKLAESGRKIVILSNSSRSQSPSRLLPSPNLKMKCFQAPL